MPKKPPLPVGPLPDLMKWWRKNRVKGMIIGGLAVALLGRPRVTANVDAVVLVEEADWPALFESAADFGLSPRMLESLRFAQEARVLLLRHDKTGVNVDIAFGNLPFERAAVARSRRIVIGKTKAPLPIPEDLIVLKAMAHRPNDLMDIAGLLQVHPNLDVKHMRACVEELAVLLESPEIYQDLDRLLVDYQRRARGPKRGK